MFGESVIGKRLIRLRFFGFSDAKQRLRYLGKWHAAHPKHTEVEVRQRRRLRLARHDA
jgi:hypothetical protein